MCTFCSVPPHDDGKYMGSCYKSSSDISMNFVHQLMHLLMTVIPVSSIRIPVMRFEQVYDLDPDSMSENNDSCKNNIENNFFLLGCCLQRL